MISTHQVMKAITYSEYGPPEVLRVEDVPKPACGDDEVLVRVRAAEATKADCELRRFRFAVNWFWLPLRLALGVRRPRQRVLGGYFAGEVAAVGKAVTGLSIGERVYGGTGLRLGTYAYMVRPAMQEGNRCFWQKETLQPYIRHRMRVVADPRALMEFARLPVLISLTVSAKPAGG